MNFLAHIVLLGLSSLYFVIPTQAQVARELEEEQSWVLTDSLDTVDLYARYLLVGYETYSHIAEERIRRHMWNYTVDSNNFFAYMVYKFGVGRAMAIGLRDGEVECRILPLVKYDGLINCSGGYIGNFFDDKYIILRNESEDEDRSLFIDEKYDSLFSIGDINITIEPIPEDSTSALSTYVRDNIDNIINYTNDEYQNALFQSGIFKPSVGELSLSISLTIDHSNWITQNQFDTKRLNNASVYLDAVVTDSDGNELILGFPRNYQSDRIDNPVSFNRRIHSEYRIDTLNPWTTIKKSINLSAGILLASIAKHNINQEALVDYIISTKYFDSDTHIEVSGELHAQPYNIWWALGNMNSVHAINILISHLDHQDPYIRYQIVKVLSPFSSNFIVEALLDRVSEEHNEMVLEELRKLER